jgi:hypothetical protein
LEEKNTENNIKNGKKITQNHKVLRCINIDCVFNSSNERGAMRNTCNHPNVVVESRFADITIAICSEFRSKKDYGFERPDLLIDLKTNEKTEIIGKPDPGSTTIEKITTEDLEKDVKGKKRKPDVVDQSTKVPETISETVETLKPLVIEAASGPAAEFSQAEIYNQSYKPGTDFLILKKLYQPYTRRGLTGSIIFHLFLLFLMYQFLVPREEKNDAEHNQRIVVVEDLEMPKFDPPDIDKINEEEQRLKDEGEIKDNTKDVRPNIIKKTVIPKIQRPKDNTPPEDTNKIAVNDSNRVKLDSSLIKSMRDTSRIQVPDSMRANFDQNDIGLKLWYPLGWKILDNRMIDLTQKEFNGVILNTDSLSEDPGAVNMFILIDDPKHSAYNKATYKNPFLMDDSLSAAYVTDPIKSSGKKYSTKYYLFTDPTGLKNIQVNVDFASQAMMEKYQKLVDAVIRSIKIVEPPKPKDP